MPQTRRLLILAPGLLGPVADADAVAALCPSLPALESYLRIADAREDVHAGRFEAARFAPFGLGGTELPVAAVSRFGEADGGTAHVGESCWLRADPVHLRVDTHTARLFGDHVLGLDPGEADALVQRLNEHFAADGLRFEAPAPDRWYVALREDVQLSTHPPHRVAGRNIDTFLPSGEDAGQWRRWMNEAQMLLHDAPVNREREGVGRLPVNSIWPWGAGRLPPQPLETVPDAVWAEDPVTLGLARLANVQAEALPRDARAWHPAPGFNLLVTTRALEPLVHGDIEEWLAQVAHLDEAWLAPVQRCLAAQEIDTLDLAVDRPTWFRLRRPHRRRLWRRRHAWTRWLTAQ